MAGAFAQSAAILLREGLEALLVVAALAAYLEKAGARDRLPALYAGAGLAVIASLITAWLFALFNNGEHNDLVEGVVMLAAAALMLYVSGWLFVRQDPKRLAGHAEAAGRRGARRKAARSSPSRRWRSWRCSAKAPRRCCSSTRLSKTVGGYAAGLIGGLVGRRRRAGRAVLRHQPGRAAAAAAAAVPDHRRRSCS